MLPSVDELLRTSAGRKYITSEGSAAATAAARSALAKLRDSMGDMPRENLERCDLITEAEAQLGSSLSARHLSQVRPVINATGVVIHTNLGRAPLSEEAKTAVRDVSGHCSLEYDLETGKRGHRGGRIDRLISELTGAEDALVVNNGAAAVFLVLTALAQNTEVVISRGELVEIGGDFRIPDVLTASGAILREVGTTNRTKLFDYERAINPNTGMILRVHPSNFRIIGFTAAPKREELAAFARQHNVVFYEDLGSGALIDMSTIGLADEPVVKPVVEAGVDLVSFSSDKLVGAAQAGIIVGGQQLIKRLRKHPLYRVLRPDKLTFAVLDATLQAYRRGEMFEKIPVLRQLAATPDSIAERISRLIQAVQPVRHLQLRIIDGFSTVGGGAAPAQEIPTKLITASRPDISATELERRFRLDSEIPVITRIEADKVMLDLRTVLVEDEERLIDAVRRVDR